jgi:hypothetical protein
MNTMTILTTATALLLVFMMAMCILIVVKSYPSRKMIAEKRAQLELDTKMISEYTTDQLLEEIKRRITISDNH